MWFSVATLALAACVGVHGSNFADTTYQDQLVTVMLQAEANRQRNPMYTNELPAVKCFPDLGCFNKEPIGVLPEDAQKIQPKLKLYIPEMSGVAHEYDYNSTVGSESLQVRKALSDPSRRLVFITHGYGGNSDLDWVRKIREYKSQKLGCNVIVIDWRYGARYLTLYAAAAANAPVVARMSSVFAKRLTETYNIPMHQVQFVGFSLGGQIAGFFAEYMFTKTGQKLGKVSALDTASPLFEAQGVYPRKEYTEFLEAVHTSAGNVIWRGKVGIETKYGHVDYYPNGGIDQPGCRFPNVACAHNRAVDYYIEALMNENSCRYTGHPCESVEKAQRGDCDPNRDHRNFMSMSRPKVGDSIIYLKTSSKAPYCLEEYSI